MLLAVRNLTVHVIWMMISIPVKTIQIQILGVVALLWIVRWMVWENK